VDWRPGTNIWYGMAMFVPRLADWCWWAPIRWDNFASRGSGADVGGLTIEDGRMQVEVAGYSSQQQITASVRVPEHRWFWVEVHQRLAGADGEALTELYLDGRRVARSTAAHSAGRGIDHIRFGAVAMDGGCSLPSAAYFDRVSLSGATLGPPRPRAATGGRVR